MIYGLIGEKLKHSHSPGIHRIFFDLTGKKGEYKLFELKKNELGTFLLKARNDNIRGINVTIPYKADIIDYMDELSGEARKIGAVNTITLSGGFKGYNTDYFGIEYTIEKFSVKISGGNVLVTGSGGAAKAVVAYLDDCGAGRIFMVSREPRSAKEKFPSVTAISYEDITAHAPFDIIINTTPVGMFPCMGASPLTKWQIKGSRFLFDLIYNPEKTKLMEYATDLGIPCVNGLYMLVAQAVKAQEVWNNEKYGKDLTDAIYKKWSDNKV